MYLPRHSKSDCGWFIRHRGRARCQTLFARQSHDEGSAFAEAGAAHMNRAAMQLDEMANDRKTESQPAMFTGRCAVGLAKPFEYMWEKARFDAFTGVLHAKFEVTGLYIPNEVHIH